MDRPSPSGIFGLRESDASRGMPPGSVCPRIDHYESERALLFFADLPGVEEDQLSLEVEGDVMVLRGERLPETLPNPAGQRVGALRYYRRFGIPRGIDLSEVDARLSNGVLRIKLPKVAVPATKIAVTGKAEEPEAESASIDWARLSVPPSEPPSGDSQLNLGPFLAAPRRARRKAPPRPPSSRSKLRAASVVTEHAASAAAELSDEDVEELNPTDWVLD